MSELESRRRHPSNPSHAEALHERMSDRLHMLRREYEGLGEVADQTRGKTGWMFRRDSVQDESRELLIFITPRILKG